MDKKYIVGVAVLVIVVGAGSFYGGMRYDQSQRTNQFAARGAAGAGQGAGAMGRTGGQGSQRVGGGQGGAMNGGAGDFAGGQISAKDDTSITIKTRNGGSQIVFFAPSTTIDKSVSGASADLSVGQQVTANGKSNADGSLAATTIQIRPDTPQGQ